MFYDIYFKNITNWKGNITENDSLLFKDDKFGRSSKTNRQKWKRETNEQRLFWSVWLAGIALSLINYDVLKEIVPKIICVSAALAKTKKNMTDSCLKLKMIYARFAASKPYREL